MKNKLREEKKRKRQKMSCDDVKKKSEKICKFFLESEIYKNSECIMLYYPLGNEVLTFDILNKIFSDKKIAVLPVTDSVTNEIESVLVNENTKYSKGAYSVMTPEGKVYPKDKIDVCIVPGICFSKRGERVGFGKGCYDGFLKDSEVIKVGFCYDFQLTHEKFAEAFDINMDYLVTESGMFCCKENGMEE